MFHRTTFRPAAATRAPSGDTATLPDRPTVCELENTPANTSWRHPPPDQTARSLAGYLGHPRTTLTDSHRGCPRTPAVRDRTTAPKFGALRCRHQAPSLGRCGAGPPRARSASPDCGVVRWWLTGYVSEFGLSIAPSSSGPEMSSAESNSSASVVSAVALGQTNRLLDSCTAPCSAERATARAEPPRRLASRPSRGGGHMPRLPHQERPGGIRYRRGLGPAGAFPTAGLRRWRAYEIGRLPEVRSCDSLLGEVERAICPSRFGSRDRRRG